MKTKPSECYVISGKVIQDRLDELNAIKSKSMAGLINLSNAEVEIYKSQEKFLKELKQSKSLVPIIEGAFNDGLKSGMGSMGSYRDRQNLLNNEIEI